MIHLITTLIIFTLKIFNIYSSWSEISLNFRKCLSLDCHEFFGRNTPNDVKRMLLDFHRHKGLMLKMFTQSYIYVEVIYISQMLPSRVAPTERTPIFAKRFHLLLWNARVFMRSKVYPTFPSLEVHKDEIDLLGDQHQGHSK